MIRLHTDGTVRLYGNAESEIPLLKEKVNFSCSLSRENSNEFTQEHAYDP